MTISGPYRMIISGGGTGGHIFPALAIANTFRDRHPGAEILFVGAMGRMEMTRVPEAGYRIVGLWIAGLQRRLTLSNLLFPVKLLVSTVRAFSIVRRFRPHVVVGTGGYASGPVMIAATRSGVPTLLQEQNSYAGLTNKNLAAKASVICVAYEGMEKYFPAGKVRLTGNPVRESIGSALSREAALAVFGLTSSRPTLLVLGGSLGAGSINESILAGIDEFNRAGVQVIWQCGKRYLSDLEKVLAARPMENIRLSGFISSMDAAYAAADVVISRSGALSISELCIAGKPVILVPSPNVAEDHQTRNALALTERSAAMLVRDDKAHKELVPAAIALLGDEARRKSLAAAIGAMARPDATLRIVEEIEKLINRVKE